MDVDFKSKEEIFDRVRKMICKSEYWNFVFCSFYNNLSHKWLYLYFNSEVLQKEAEAELANPANFGSTCSRHCICEIPGQLPCPSLVPLPKSWRGKYKFQKSDEL